MKKQTIYSNMYKALQILKSPMGSKSWNIWLSVSFPLSVTTHGKTASGHKINCVLELPDTWQGMQLNMHKAPGLIPQTTPNSPIPSPVLGDVNVIGLGSALCTATCLIKCLKCSMCTETCQLLSYWGRIQMCKWLVMPRLVATMKLS